MNIEFHFEKDREAKLVMDEQFKKGFIDFLLLDKKAFPSLFWKPTIQ